MRKTLSLLAAAAVLSIGVAHAESARYALDPQHTFVTFEIGHMGTSTNRARFDKKSGEVSLDKAAKSGKVDVTIEVNSVSSGWDAFNKHLQSADLFNAEKFPQLHFVGDKFTFDGDKVTAIDGNLTLLGQTHPVTLTATNFNCYQSPMLKREVCGGDFVANIDRTQWGMNYGLDWGFPKMVKLVIQAEAVKQ